MPPAGANAKSTVRPWKTRIVLHAILGSVVFGVGSTQGMAQRTGPQVVFFPVSL
jgi:hypothetical protein